jgi:hypothetical protein
MNEFNKKNYLENDKINYNVNSFRGLYTDKSKQEKEVKLQNNVLSPRVVLQSTDRNDKDTTKGQLKPRLLTAKLPAAFDVKYRRYFYYVI